ncbi:MAG: ATP-dependent helicase, partial [SAR324 cluster bacterium]|nr:ATP-dependent helicase [SAR324 cluster bacterium]
IDISGIKALLPQAIEQANQWMQTQRKIFEDHINEKLNNQLAALEKLRAKQHDYLERKFANSRYSEGRQIELKDSGKREIDKIFDEYLQWVEDTMTTENQPYIQIIAVLTRQH